MFATFEKSPKIQTIMKTLFLMTAFLAYAQSAEPDIRDYLAALRANGWDVDQSSAKVCFVLSGTYEAVDPSKLELGFTCNAEIPVWTSDKAHAMDFCISQLPFHVLEAGPKGLKTRCKFIVTTVCQDGFYQINNVCYKVEEDEERWTTYADADKLCKSLHVGKPDIRIAEFYSPHLQSDMEQMSFPHAWVQVPDLSFYYENAGDTEGALYVLDSAEWMDTEGGKIKLADLKEKHPPMCQYTPEISPAQMNLLAQQYTQIYPIVLTPKGAGIASSGYYPADSSMMGNACKAVASVVGIQSTPIPSNEEVRQTVAPLLEHHRLQHTEKTNVSYGSASAVKTMVELRAPVLCTLASFTFKAGGCPDDSWLRYERSPGRVFCHKHFAKNKQLVERHVAVAHCATFGARLTGFESREEMEAAVKHCAPTTCNTNQMADYHNWVGIIPGCKNAGCRDEHKAQWEEGVSLNLDLLIGLIDFGRAVRGHLCHYSTIMEYHIHPIDQFSRAHYWCGMFANKVALPVV